MMHLRFKSTAYCLRSSFGRPTRFQLFQVGFFVFSSVFQLSESCNCGLSPANRIYNGYQVSSSDYPWMGSIVCKVGGDLTLCGASMISSQWALTAGHCGPKSNATKCYMVFGENADDAYEEENGYPLYPIDNFIIKSRHSDGADIALIHLKSPLDVEPICLPSSTNSYAGVKARLLGYGQTEYSDDSKYLLAGDFTIPSNEVCGMIEPVQSTEICGGNYGGAPAMCDGDSGGPLMYQDPSTGKYAIIGVVSASFNCSDTKSYGVFTRVSSYIGWIQQETRNAACQP